MKPRLFRLYDKDVNEIGCGIYNPKTGKVAVSMPTQFDKYQVFFLMRSVLELCHSFMWCCPNSKSWHGHEKLNELVK